MHTSYLLTFPTLASLCPSLCTDYVARHYLASLSPDCILKKTKAVLTGGGETFSVTGSIVIKPGFTAVMPWRGSDPALSLPAMRPGEGVPFTEVELYQVRRVLQEKK
jgi:DNA topoisomerase III